MDDIERLKELLARVTGGNWSLMEYEQHDGVSRELEIWNEDIDVLVATEVRRAGGDGGRDALNLIVETHNALPALLSQLEDMWEALEGLRSTAVASHLSYPSLQEYKDASAAFDDALAKADALLSQTDEGENMEGNTE